MTTFLSAVASTALGTFAGNFILVALIGYMQIRMARKITLQNQKLNEEATKALILAVQKEQERMQKYAELEG